MYVLSTPDGELYACGRPCVADVLGIVPVVVAVHWSTADLDVFCAGCADPLGSRRRSAQLLHRLMTSEARGLYLLLQASEAPTC